MFVLMWTQRKRRKSTFRTLSRYCSSCCYKHTLSGRWYLIWSNLRPCRGGRNSNLRCLRRIYRHLARFNKRLFFFKSVWTYEHYVTAAESLTLPSEVKGNVKQIWSGSERSYRATQLWLPELWCSDWRIGSWKSEPSCWVRNLWFARAKHPSHLSPCQATWQYMTCALVGRHLGASVDDWTLVWDLNWRRPPAFCLVQWGPSSW